jgi:hypothetical protein
MSKTKTIYQVEIPEVIARNPEQAIIDGFTVLHQQGGIPMVEAALEAVMEVIYPSAS